MYLVTAYNGPRSPSILRSDWWISNSLPYAERVAFDDLLVKLNTATAERGAAWS